MLQGDYRETKQRGFCSNNSVTSLASDITHCDFYSCGYMPLLALQTYDKARLTTNNIKWFLNGDFSPFPGILCKYRSTFYNINFLSGPGCSSRKGSKGPTYTHENKAVHYLSYCSRHGVWTNVKQTSLNNLNMYKNSLLLLTSLKIVNASLIVDRL
jgi:hypothetical protein